MKYKRLGRTGFNVSEMGFGGIPIMSGRDSEFMVSLKGVEYQNAINTINHAYENGINFFDTALDYGDSEEKIGKALKNFRSNIYIASKSKALTYDQMKKDVLKSLKALGTDYIDLYQLHFVRDKHSYDTIMDEEKGAYLALLEYKRKGYIREIGIASHNSYVIEPAIKSGKFSSVQLPVNLIENENIYLINLAQELDMGVIAMKPLAGGTLTTKHPKVSGIVDCDEEMKSLALTYVFSQNITTAIPGVSDIYELKENLKIYYSKCLITEVELEKISLIKRIIGNTFCRRCQYCEPCPQNIEISKILRLYKYYEDYNLKDWAKEQYFEIKNRADKCISCYQCERKCPYELEIVSKLKTIHMQFSLNDTYVLNK